MEVELVTNEISEEDTFQIGNDNDDSTFEGERCGICMDLIVDRGVLDCCQHWFCFSCIDNWATITNLCPLCQNEFQLITCVPVYDTIGSNKLEEDSYSRDDEWSIEGKNSSLSFPSYYIDENAVVCLDGDGCKIRSGHTIEEDSDFDTSIACDSCDKWYHAFCVEFDPENTIEGTWLCPRCIACEVQQRPDNTSVQKPSEQCSSANASGESLAEAAFSRKVSVSVADVGETALVVSMVGGSQWTKEPTVGGSQWTEEPTVSYLSKPEVGRNLEKETLASRFGGNSLKVEKLSNKRIDSLPEMDAQELALSLSHDKPLCEIENNFSDKAMNKHCIDGFRISSIEPFSQSYDKEELSGSDSRIGLNLGLSVGSFLSDDHIKNNGNKDQVAVGIKQGSPSDEFTSPSDKKIVHSATVGAAGVTGIKRKHTDCSADGFKHAEDDGFSEKKVRTKVMIETISSADQASKSHSNDPKKCPNLIAVTQDDKGRHNVKKEDTTSDIMSIVKGTNCRPVKEIASSNFADKSAKEREAGLRVKKIMRRAARDKESSVVVQELRKEIREAVQNKSPIEFGDNLFDPKLLAAFRTAVAGPVTEPTSHLVVKAKKSMLQKGKTRDNLTKKIYGMNGKRRRAWDRECEIEFWKHRCMRTSRPEKIGTLKSVLDLLKKNSGSEETGQQSESQATNPILSRLYLADTSVFPRKDNIKPLSALNVACTAKLSEEQRNSMEDASKSPLINQVVQMPETNNFSPKVYVPSFDKEKKNSVPCVKSSASSSKVNLNRSLEGSLSLVGGSKVKTKKEAVVKSEDIRSDKRKWALEVLARKTAVAGSNVTQEKQEDSAVLKGNYPLLAQLPSDMRPLLAPSRHNKIPISVRQAQLYRLTEHFLRNANLPVIRRTGDTELAVADAVNIEKDVADRSNSKLVYVNLCSQELLRHSNNSNTDRGMESNSSHPSANSADGTEPETNNPSSSLAVSSDRSEQATNNISDPDVEQALRTAGLLSDSPPDSPLEETKDLSDEDDPPKKREEGVNNKNEMDSLVELDIYGDFEYDLEDEDYIGASASASTVNLTKPQSGESRLKVVFSTLDSERPQNAVNCENCEELGISEVAKDSTNLLKCSTAEDITDKPSCPLEALHDEEGEELSVAECEELYGPDKAPLLERFPGAPEKLFGTVGAETVAENLAIERGENCAASKQVKASELVNESHSENQILISVNRNSTGEKISPNSSQTSENVQRKEKKSNTNPNNQSDSSNFVSKKVEAYIKEHIRPLCKSGVITAEQYRWAVAKTTEKVMKYHLKDKNANFLIKEGEKVKKLAEQYVETAQQKEKK